MVILRLKGSESIKLENISRTYVDPIETDVFWYLVSIIYVTDSILRLSHDAIHFPMPFSKLPWHLIQSDSHAQV